MATADKYDRQLRLWGANGQAALMSAHVLLVNAGPTGTETLKNLVLPGVGRFTVLDGATVTESDLGNNFFVEADSVGRPRADVVTELLCEMNPDVKGTALVADLEEYDSDEAFVSQFSIVVASQLGEAPLLRLADTCWRRGVPLLACRSFGLVGHVRLAVRQHDVVESKPDASVPDLRLSRPWPELAAHCAETDLAALDSMGHAHVPCVVILVQLARRWRDAHGGAAPATADERQQFRESVRAAARDFDNEINFQEAYADAWKAFAAPNLPAEAAALLAEASACTVGPDTPPFWVLLRAVHEFMNSADGDAVGDNGGGSSGGADAGLPPLKGEVPDMAADTDRFVRLQEVYRSKAQADRAAVAARAKALLAAAGRSADDIPTEETDRFCRNVANLRSLRTRSLAQERAIGIAGVGGNGSGASSTANGSSSCSGGTADGGGSSTSGTGAGSANAAEFVNAAITEAMEDPYEVAEQTPALWYVALRGVDRFEARHGRLPGSGAGAGTAIADGLTLWAETVAMLREWGLAAPAALSRKHAQEMARYGGAELHNVAAVVGGVASQEAVKLITKQYVPVNNTVVFNGVVGVIGIYEF